MGLTYEACERLFSLGEYAELVRLSESSGRSVDSRVRGLVAHSLVLTGQFQKAAALAQEVEQHGGDGQERWRASLVLALVAEAQGDMAAAMPLFHLALQNARESRSAEPVAWTQLALFRHMINGHSLDALLAMMPLVRHAVIRAGSRHATAYLHQCVSVLEGHLGRVDEARRHCDIADAVLEDSPNAALSLAGLLNRACVDYIGCDYRSATNHILNARPLVARIGLAHSFAISLNNLGHIYVLTGSFERARRTFDEVVASPRTSPLALLGAYDGLARLHLATDNLSECENTLSLIERTTDAQEALRRVYHVRWSAITRARLMLKRKEPTEALRWIKGVEKRSADIGDAPFLAALQLTAAHAYVDLGDLREAADRILRADLLGVTRIREFQGQFHYARSCVGISLDGAFSRTCLQRAERIWKSEGVVPVALETDIRPRSDLPLTDAVGEERSRSSSLASVVVDSVAALFDATHNRKLFSAELTALLSLLGYQTQAYDDRSKQSPAGTFPTGRDRLALTVDVHDAVPLVISCRIPPDPLKALLLADILRIARAALALEHAREEERRRAAIWPAAPVEEQAGALFVAEEMQTLLATARRIATTNIPVLITGETGTGKEVLARTIHAYSPRAAAAFVPFNCSAVPKDMLDSQLFGHRRGAFTGAVDHFPGVIRAAAAGTLFLDEIGETTPDVQPKLLRFLEASEVHPIGETQPTRVDVRVIAATNADLEALVADGRFREDLFYRLNIIRLHVPPLRERRVEIPALANHYLQKHAQEYRKGELRLAEETMEYLVLYRWPGNVRQLANEMRRMAALAESGAVIMPEHLSTEIAASRRTIPPSDRVLDPTEMVVRIDQPLAAAVQHVERAMIQHAIRKSGGRMEETAALLGLSRKGLYLKRLRYGLETPEAPDVEVA